MNRYNILLQPDSPAAEQRPAGPDHKRSKPETKHPAPATEGAKAQARAIDTDPGTVPSSRSVGSPSDRPVGQSTDRSTGPSTEVSINQVVGRPKAFYITERLDRWLDQAANYYQTVHRIKRVDRSTIINALLDDESLWSEEALDQSAHRVISQLTSRLTG